MSFLRELIGAADSPTSAYLQFLTEKGREDYAAFAFVEDEDDVAFYQHVLSDVQNVCYLGCGGKNGVFTVYNRLCEEGRADGHLFMVDRDHEEPPFSHAEAVLRTRVYSWEAHLCAPSIVRVCVQRKARPNLTAPQTDQLEGLWLSTLDQFHQAFCLHAALLKMRNKAGRSLGLRKLRFSEGAVHNQGRLEPSPGLMISLQEKVESANFEPPEQAELMAARDSYASKSILAVARGKNLFDVLRSFLVPSLTHIGAELAEQVNSPLHILAVTRWDHEDFDYIRQYAATRVGVG